MAIFKQGNIIWLSYDYWLKYTMAQIMAEMAEYYDEHPEEAQKDGWPITD